MAAIPRHLRSSLLLCLRRQTLALATADRGWRGFKFSSFHHSTFVDLSHINMVGQQALIKKPENMSEALWNSKLHFGCACTFVTTSNLILTLRLKHLAILQHTRDKPCCTFQDPTQKHLLPMQGKEASNPSSASWKDPFLDQMLTVGTMLVPVLQANSVGGWRHFVPLFDLGCSIISIFIFWVKPVTQMIIAGYTYQTNKL